MFEQVRHHFAVARVASMVALIEAIGGQATLANFKPLSYNVPIWLEGDEGVAKCRNSNHSGLLLLQRW